MNKNPKISFIIPVYKDESSINELYSQIICLFNEPIEIIFINDASPDNTGNIIDQISLNDHRVVAIHHLRNFGSQAAIANGIDFASGDLVIPMDGDLQDPPAVAFAMYQTWQKDQNPLVLAQRTNRQNNIILTFFTKTFYRIWNLIAPFRIPNDVGDFCLLESHYAKQICRENKSPFYFRVNRAFLGLKSSIVEYNRPERAYGKSTNSWFALARWAYWFITESNPRFDLLVITLGGLCFMIGNFWLGIFFLLAGIVLYLRLIYQHSLNRPLYIRKKITRKS